MARRLWYDARTGSRKYTQVLQHSGSLIQQYTQEYREAKAYARGTLAAHRSSECSSQATYKEKKNSAGVTNVFLRLLNMLISIKHSSRSHDNFANFWQLTTSPKKPVTKSIYGWQVEPLMHLVQYSLPYRKLLKSTYFVFCETTHKHFIS